jgi:SAM-dependent methyltransferase
VQHKRDWSAFAALKQATLDRLGVDRLERRLRSAGGGEMRALDLGCGEGALLQVLERRGWEAWGLELCPPLAGRAQKQGLRAVAGSLEGPWPEGGQLPTRYSLVLMNHLLEHLRNPLAALARARALLEPDGRLVLETPLQPDLDNIDHLHCFSAAALERALSDRGLQPLGWYDYVDDNYRHHNLACIARPSP